MTEKLRSSDFGGPRALAGVVGLIGIALVPLVVIPAVRTVQQQKKAVIRDRAIQVSDALKQYRMEIGTYPEGDNAQILKALMGDNPRRMVFFEPAAVPKSFDSFNDRGDLIDFWGTPYRFDLTDPKIPRVWSCGKDRRDDGGAVGSDDIPS